MIFKKYKFNFDRVGVVGRTIQILRTDKSTDELDPDASEYETQPPNED